MTEFFSFHCDLIPRLDLGTSLGYMDHVYGPLSENWDAVQGLDGVTPAMLSRRQYAIMSPWMLVGRANTDAFNSLFPHVDAFCTRFLDILEDGIPADTYASVSGKQLATRSAENRKLIFNADVDPVWEKIEGMLGPDMCERQREVLRGADL